MKSKKQKQDEAKARQAAREARGDAGQLRHLENLGYGHTREAKRLRKALSK